MRPLTRVAALLTLIIALFGVPSTAGAVAPGGFDQLASPLGCLSNAGAGGCTSLHDMSRSFDILVSPDGKNVYAAGFDTSTIVVMDRNRATGALTQKSGNQGCVKKVPATAGCRGARFLDNPIGLAITPNGKTVYVASRFGNSTILTFDRDTNTGALTQRPGDQGCIADDNSSTGAAECRDGRALAGPSFLTVTNDGRHLYVAAGGGGGSVSALAIGANGVLTQVTDGSGGSGCVENVPSADACQDGRALSGPFAINADSSSSTIYVAAFSDAAISAIGRDPATGRLAPISGPTGCVDRWVRPGPGARHDPRRRRRARRPARLRARRRFGSRPALRPPVQRGTRETRRR
jgi:DNA-binding beta-propeller fold protein YncE